MGLVYFGIPNTNPLALKVSFEDFFYGLKREQSHIGSARGKYDIFNRQHPSLVSQANVGLGVDGVDSKANNLNP